jgi:hypothetical protein
MDGKCGAGPAFCGVGKCQSGNCDLIIPTPPPEPTRSSATKTASATAVPSGISTDGSCGGTKGLKCGSDQFGYCCSSSGYCGKAVDHCAQGWYVMHILPLAQTGDALLIQALAIVKRSSPRLVLPPTYPLTMANVDRARAASRVLVGTLMASVAQAVDFVAVQILIVGLDGEYSIFFLLKTCFSTDVAHSQSGFGNCR